MTIEGEVGVGVGRGIEGGALKRSVIRSAMREWSGAESHTRVKGELTVWRRD